MDALLRETLSNVKIEPRDEEAFNSEFEKLNKQFAVKFGACLERHKPGNTAQALQALTIAQKGASAQRVIADGGPDPVEEMSERLTELADRRDHYDLKAWRQAERAVYADYFEQLLDLCAEHDCKVMLDLYDAEPVDLLPLSTFESNSRMATLKHEFTRHPPTSDVAVALGRATGLLPTLDDTHFVSLLGERPKYTDFHRELLNIATSEPLDLLTEHKEEVLKKMRDHFATLTEDALTAEIAAYPAPAPDTLTTGDACRAEQERIKTLHNACKDAGAQAILRTLSAQFDHLSTIYESIGR